MPKGKVGDSSNKTEIRELKSQMSVLKKELESSYANRFEQNVEELNEQLTKMISININLQSKMTELLIKVTDLVRENRELISLLEEASEQETAETTGENDSLLVEMKKITKNTYMMSESFKALESYLKRSYTKGLLSKAIGENVELEEGGEVMPKPEDGVKVDEL